MRRSLLEIEIDVLNALRQPEKLTRLTYKTNYNASNMKILLRNMIAKGLVETRGAPGKTKDSRVQYVLTDRGREAANQINHLLLQL